MVSQMSASQPVIYVDVDDTLVRSAAGKRIPISHLVTLVRELARAGATLYCWSTGGADYARESATALGMGDCFAGFLPKPALLLDDRPLSTWGLLELHPSECAGVTSDELLARLGSSHS
jgi:hypothetical protein